MSFDHTLLSTEVVATGQLIYDIATAAGWTINEQAAEDLLVAILVTAQGLTTQNVTSDTYHTVAGLHKLGARNHIVEERRREFMKKHQKSLRTKVS